MNPAKRTILVILCVTMMAAVAAAELPSAGEVRRATGVEAGLAVVLGTLDGKLEADLAADGKMLVQGLTLAPDACARAREYLFNQQVYGLASVSRVQTASTLPYYDRLVNLLVADLDALGGAAPSTDEIMRVLGYEGVTYLKQDGKWTKTFKPTPDTVDVWTHTFHDAGRSGVSRDRLAAPPNAFRWLSPSTSAQRTGGVRTSDTTVVALQRIGPVGHYRNVLELVAWDVNSGVRLWNQHVGKYLGDDQGDNLIAADGRVYTYRVPVGLVDEKGNAVWSNDPCLLHAWNIRTGKLEHVFDKTVVVPMQKGKLVASEFDTRCIYTQVSGNKVIQAWKDSLYVSDATTGQVIWSTRAQPSDWWRWPLIDEDRLLVLRTDATSDNPRVGYHATAPVARVRAVECFALVSGKKLWTCRDFKGEPITNGWGGLRDGLLTMSWWVADDERRMSSKRRRLTLIETRTGRARWSSGVKWVGNEQFPMILGNTIWLADQTGQGERVDLATGEVLGGFRTAHLATCQTSCLTPNYLLLKKTWVPLDQDWLQSRVRFFVNRALSLQCRMKFNPSYGTVWDQPNGCTCEAFLPGTVAFYATPPVTPVDDAARLEVGGAKPLAAVKPQSFAGAVAAADWRPVVFTEWMKPEDLAKAKRVHRLASYRGKHVQWGEKDRGDCSIWHGCDASSTAPVRAGDLTLTAYPLEHRLEASRDGRPVWNFVAGARIGQPPVVHQGRTYFGSHDGYVYAVNLSDGTLAWRFLAAVADRRHMVVGQLESAWPVFNVVLHEGRLYFSAGRHPELDGGIHFYALDLDGKLQWHVRCRRGLGTEEKTYSTPVSSSMGKAYNKWKDRLPWDQAQESWIINDVIRVEDGKLWLRAFPVVDLRAPKDTIINPNTLSPPGAG